MKWSDWFDTGYGPQEFHRDRHVVWVVFLTYAITRIPQYQSFNWEQCKQDLLTVGVMAFVTLAKSYLGNNTPPTIPPVPPG